MHTYLHFLIFMHINTNPTLLSCMLFQIRFAAYLFQTNIHISILLTIPFLISSTVLYLILLYSTLFYLKLEGPCFKPNSSSTTHFQHILASLNTILRNMVQHTLRKCNFSSTCSNRATSSSLCVVECTLLARALASTYSHLLIRK